MRNRNSYTTKSGAGIETELALIKQNKQRIVQVYTSTAEDATKQL